MGRINPFVGCIMLLLACQEQEEPLGVNSYLGESLVIGDRLSAVHYRVFDPPDSVFVDQIHAELTGLDLTQDGRDEVFLLSQQDSIYFSTHSAFPEIVFFALQVKGAKHLDAVYIALDERNHIKSYEAGTLVHLPTENFQPLAENLLTLRIEDLLLGYEDEIDLWNGINKGSFLIIYELDDLAYLSTITLSISDFDNFILHEHTSFVFAPEIAIERFLD